MKTNTKSALMNAPREDVFGFHGTLIRNENLGATEAEAAWVCAMEIITDFAGGNAILARNFLRHRVGRHFADAVTNEGFLHAGALSHRIQEAACEQWVRSCLGRLFFEGDGDALYPNDPARNAPNPL